MTHRDPDRLFLCGYLPVTDQGFALPCFASAPVPNQWYAAVCTIDGDHSGRIAAFETFHSSTVVRLPEGTLREAAVGDPWLDVFLWQERALVGTPAEIWNALGAEREAVSEHLPLSLLDLGLFVADSDRHALLNRASAYVSERYSADRTTRWQTDHIIRPRLLLLLRRWIANGKLPSEESDARAITAWRDLDTFAAWVPPNLHRDLQETGLMGDLQAELESLSLAFEGISGGIRTAVPNVESATNAQAGDDAKSPDSADDEIRPDRSVSEILLLVDGKRATQIANHLRPAEWMPSFSEERARDGMVVARGYGSTPTPAPGSLLVRVVKPPLRQPFEHPPAAVIILADDEAAAERWREYDILESESVPIILAPALDRSLPSAILMRPDGYRISRLVSAILDTSRARSPLAQPKSRRALDRRIADMVVSAAALVAVPAVQERLRKRSKIGRFMTFGVQEPNARSEHHVHDDLWLSSESIRVAEGFRFDDVFSAVWQRGGEETVGIIYLDRARSDFRDFARAVLIARSTGVISLSYGNVAPEHVAKHLAFPDACASLATTLRTETDGNMIITAEAPAVPVLRAAAEMGYAMLRYTDRTSQERLFSGDRPFSEVLPDDIRLPPLRRHSENRRLVTRGIDVRDVVRVWESDLRRFTAEKPGLPLLGLARAVRRSEPRDEETRAIAFPRWAVERALMEGDPLADWLQNNGLGGPGRRGEPAKRSGDLLAAWEGRRDLRRFVLADGSLPVRVQELDPGEVPGESLFLIHGDSSVPILYSSSVFSVWARATLSLSESWMQRFSIGRTFDGFRIRSPFRILTKDDHRVLSMSVPNLRGKSIALWEELSRRYSRLLAEDDLLQSSENQQLVDEFVFHAYDIPRVASELDILERLLRENAVGGGY